MLFQDVRYAFRSLVRSPGFTLVAVVCLALGIGTNSTIFSVIDGVILNPHPYPDPERLFVVNSTNQRIGVRWAGVSYPDFKDIRERGQSFTAVAAFTGRSLTIADGGAEPERYSGMTVSWNLFEMLGAHPILGRNFGPEDDRPGAEPVILLSHEVWQNRYGSDPGVIGRAINVNGRSHTIVGVMPPRFAFPENQRLWVPLAPYAESTKRGERSVQVFARLKPNATAEQASTELQGIAATFARDYPTSHRDWGLRTRRIREWMLPDQVKLILLTMMGAVTLVLIVACANVANLLLARASVRHREICVRAALGAGRWRIIRQLLTEAILIGLFAAPLGFALAWVGVRLVDAAMPPESVPYFIHWSLNGRALIYTVGISMLTGIVFGLVPALHATSANLQESLKEGGRGSAGGRRAWVRNTLVVAEVALSLVLLIGASLFVRSFLNLKGADAGFATGQLLTLRFYLPGDAYEAADAKAQRVDDVVRRVESLPGVQAAFSSNFIPFGSGGGDGVVIVEGKPAEPEQEKSINFVGTTPHLRRTLDVALVRGRDMTDSEGATRSGVAVINQTMAKDLWPDEDPVGRRFRIKGAEDAGEAPDWFTVIGVIADFRHFQGDSDRPVFPSAYVPYPYQQTLNTGLVVRTAGDPATITSAVREAVRASDPNLPVFSVSTMEALRQRSFWQFKLFGQMFAMFGAIALLLASIGVYGVLSYAVTQRRQEIGVRVALGAGRRDVFRLIIGHGLKLAAIGIVLGAIAARSITPAIQSVLFQVTPSDPLSFAGVALFLVMIAFAASYFPARRALAVDPLIALRNE
jgi:putative ABC transport system permease protein